MAAPMLLDVNGLQMFSVSMQGNEETLTCPVDMLCPVLECLDLSSVVSSLGVCVDSYNDTEAIHFR